MRLHVSKGITPSSESPLNASVIPPEPRSVLLRSGSSSRLEHRRRLDSWLEDHIKQRDVLYGESSNQIISSTRVEDEKHDFSIESNMHNNNQTIAADQASFGSSLFDSDHDESRQRHSSPETKEIVFSLHSHSIDDLFSDENEPVTAHKHIPAEATTPPPVVPDQEDDDGDTVQYSPTSTPPAQDTIPHEPTTVKQDGDDACTLSYNPYSPSTQHDSDTFPYDPYDSPKNNHDDQVQQSTRYDDNDDADTLPYDPYDSPKSSQQRHENAGYHSPKSIHDQQSTQHDDNGDADTLPYDPYDSQKSHQSVQQSAEVLKAKTSPNSSLFDPLDDDDIFDNDDLKNNINQQDNHAQVHLPCSQGSEILDVADMKEEDLTLGSPKKPPAQASLQRFFSVTTNNSPVSPSPSSFIPTSSNQEDSTTSQKKAEEDILSSMSSLSTAKSFSTNNSPLTSQSLAFTPLPKTTTEPPTTHTTSTTACSSYFSSSTHSRPQRVGLGRRPREKQPSLSDVSKALPSQSSRKRNRIGLRAPRSSQK